MCTGVFIYNKYNLNTFVLSFYLVVFLTFLFLYVMFMCSLGLGSGRLCARVFFINILRPWQNGRHFADDIFKCIFLNENAWISLKISLKCVPYVRINNIPALVQIMAWRRPGDKPLSKPMMVSLLTHICVTRPQWVDSFKSITFRIYSSPITI